LGRGKERIVGRGKPKKIECLKKKLINRHKRVELMGRRGGLVIYLQGENKEQKNGENNCGKNNTE